MSDSIPANPNSSKSPSDSRSQEVLLQHLALTAALLSVSWCSVLTAGSPFDGTWKFNPSRSQLTGDTFTYSPGPDGKLHFSDGGAWEFDFALDGKPYKTPGGSTTTWTVAGANAWDRESSFEGKVTGKGQSSLSADGKQLVSSWTEFRPNGTTAKSSDVYERVSGGPGLLGKWKNIKVEATSETLILSVPAPGQISYEMPDFKLKVSGPTDGSLIKPVGPTVSKNFFVSFRVVNPRTFSYESRLNDRVTGLGNLEVSTDGKTLVAVSWTPGKEDEKTKAVYEKK
jgi:hypothetical protein